MKRIFLSVFFLCISGLSLASTFSSFDLNRAITEDHYAESFDFTSRRFKKQTIHGAEIASATAQIGVIQQKLSRLSQQQADLAKHALMSAGSGNDEDFWNANKIQVDSENSLLEQKRVLRSKIDELEFLLRRDASLLPAIHEIIANAFGKFSTRDGIVLNYLPVYGNGNSHNQWFTSPLQLYLWKSEEQYIEEYLDKAYFTAAMFSRAFAPVLYSKSASGGKL